MFGISFPELAVIFIVLLLVLGPERLPSAARTLGNLVATFRKHSDLVRREFYNSIYKPTDDIKRSVNDSSAELRSIGSEIQKDMKEIEKAPLEEKKDEQT